MSKSTNRYLFNSTGMPAALQQANTPHFDQVYQMKAVTHATFIDVRRHALPELPSKTHASLARG